MKLGIRGGAEVDVNPENSIVTHYKNDLLDCLYIDMDEDYLVIPKHASRFNQDILPGLFKERIPVQDYTGITEIEGYPHVHVVNGVARYIAWAAEQIANENPAG